MGHGADQHILRRDPPTYSDGVQQLDHLNVCTCSCSGRAIDCNRPCLIRNADFYILLCFIGKKRRVIHVVQH